MYSLALPAGCLSMWLGTLKNPKKTMWKYIEFLSLFLVCSCRLNKNGLHVVLSNIYSHSQSRWDKLSLQPASECPLFSTCLKFLDRKAWSRNSGQNYTHTHTHTLPELLGIHTCHTLSIKEKPDTVQRRTLAGSLHELRCKKKSCQEKTSTIKKQ